MAHFRRDQLATGRDGVPNIRSQTKNNQETPRKDYRFN